MEIISLQSGSAGNCIFVHSGETRLLFDAGISASNAQMRLADYGFDIRDCDGLVLLSWFTGKWNLPLQG